MKRHILISESKTKEGGIWLDIPKLVKTRLIIQAGSGGGKSYLMKRILEQSHGSIQHIVIDVEGEFASLRERFDYVLAAKDGDTPAEPRSAKLLAERLLELKASAILDLYELKHDDRLLYVRDFLDAMVNAPKHLWHPVLVFVDEAHVFCPQQDRKESPSASAIIDLLTRGRKRGFCAVLATQRLSKLHKDAAAECQNKLIGVTSLDIDMKRAGDELGFSREHRLALRDLSPGVFFAFGPAMTRRVKQIKVGPVLTTVKRGARFKVHAPPPTQKIRKMLPSLSDIPAESEQRELTQRELKRQVADQKRIITELQKQLKLTLPEPAPVFDVASARRLNMMINRVTKLNPMRFMHATQHLANALQGIGVAVGAAANGKPRSVIESQALQRLGLMKPRPDVIVPDAVSKMLGGDNAERRIVVAIKQHPDSPATKIGSVAGVSAARSTFRLAFSRLRKAGVIDGDRHSLKLTPLGEAAAWEFPTIPTGTEAVDYWRKKLGDGAVSDIFNALLKAGQQGLSAEEINTATAVDPSVSTFRLAIAGLRKQDLITGDRKRFYINTDLL